MARHESLAPWPHVDGPRSVLFVLPQVYGPPGGIQRYNRSLLKAAGEAFLRTKFAVVSVNDEQVPKDASVRGRLHFVGAGPRNRFFHRAAFVAKVVRAAWRCRPELIVCGHINLMLLVWGLGVVSGARTMLVAHGVEAWSTSGLRRWAARRAHRVLPVSGYTAARIGEWGIRDSLVSILPNTVDGEEFRPLRRLTDRSFPCLLTVSRLDSSDGYKGVDRILGALSRIRDRFPNIRYRVVGVGDDLSRLRGMAHDLGVAAYVEFPGAAVDEALLRFYNEADVFVMLSVGEGFGIVFLEALACGTPALAGDRDGSVDALLGGRLGRLIDPEDSEALVAAVEAVLSSDGSHSLAGRQALRGQVMEAYGFERFREQMHEVLCGKREGLRR
jgi:glycosyltransferase involved in cell wall biosynthesis